MRKMETHTMVQIVLLIAGLYALLNRRPEPVNESETVTFRI